MKKLAKKISKAIEGSKVEDDAIIYVLAHAMVAVSAGNPEPEQGLNRMFELISVAAAEQGYRFKLENHTVH